MANGIEMRKLNYNLVYRTLLRNSVLSKQEMARLTGLSIPTVAQNLEKLVAKGLAEQTGIMESTGGRRAVGFRCVKSACHAVGIDITQNHIRIVVVNVAGEVVAETNRDLFRFRDEESCYEDIAARVLKLLEDTSVDPKSILGVGVSLPCIVDRANNKVTYSRIIDAPEDMAEKLAARLPFRVEVFNDANSAGYAEFYDTDRDPKDSGYSFYLMLSNSVGGAMMTPNGVYLGENSRSAEVGHMRIVPDGDPCYCGQRGCVNAYCSAKLLSDPMDGDLAAFFRLLKEGDAAAEKAFDHYLYYLALTVINIRMLFDTTIILGGYAGAFLGDYMDRLRELTVQLDPYDDNADYLKPCNFHLDASAIGAALIFIGAFIEDL